MQSLTNNEPGCRAEHCVAVGPEEDFAQELLKHKAKELIPALSSSGELVAGASATLFGASRRCAPVELAMLDMTKSQLLHCRSAW